MDVRSFGQIFPFRGSDSSSGVRGPVTISDARSLSEIEIVTSEITRVCNLDATGKRESSTMGAQYKVPAAVYVAFGGIFPQLAEINNFSDNDTQKIKHAMANLFSADATASRPSGTMTSTLFWWTHETASGKASPARVHNALHLMEQDSYPYFSWRVDPIEGVSLEVLGENSNPST